MTSSEDRFSSVGAQKGTALHVVTMAMRNVAQAVDQLYDTSLPEVRGAFQRFEQGLALLKGVTPEGYAQLREAEDGGKEDSDGKQEYPEISGAGVPESRKPKLAEGGPDEGSAVKPSRPGRARKA